MISIYKISNYFTQIMNEIESNGGEITPEIDAQLQIAEKDLVVKAENYINVIKTLDGQTDLIDTEIKRLQAMKKANNNLVDRLKSNIHYAMNTFEINELIAGLNKISFRKSEAVNILDENAIPPQFYVLEKKIQKADIKKAIKEGSIIPGAELVQNKNIQIK